MDATNPNPPLLGPQYPVWPWRSELLYVPSSSSSGSSSSSSSASTNPGLTLAYLQQWTDLTNVRSRISVYCFNPASPLTAVSSGYYIGLLVGSLLGLPLYVIACCPGSGSGGGSGNLNGTLTAGTIPYATGTTDLGNTPFVYDPILGIFTLGGVPIVPQTTGDIALLIKLLAGQTGDPFKIVTSTGTLLVQITKDGEIGTQGNTAVSGWGLTATNVKVTNRIELGTQIELQVNTNALITKQGSGTDWGWLMTGGTGASVPLQLKLQATPTADAFNIYLVDGTTKIYSVQPDGDVLANRQILYGTTIPASGDLANSQLGTYVIDTAGDAGLGYKLKDSAGTVESGSFLTTKTDQRRYNGDDVTVSASTTMEKLFLLPLPSVTLKAGLQYGFEAVLFVDADAVGGSKFAINGTGVLTAAEITYTIMLLDESTGAYTITSRETSLGGSAGQVGTTAGTCVIKGSIEVGDGGIIAVEFAQNVANGDTTVKAGSTFNVWQCKL